MRINCAHASIDVIDEVSYCNNPSNENLVS
jgi:hypothetical protein